MLTVTTSISFPDMAGLYHESEFRWQYGYVYILIAMNLSVAYAFLVLAAFYSTLKYKLKPFEPVGKFLCIKFVIFFAFWQVIVVVLLSMPVSLNFLSFV